MQERRDLSFDAFRGFGIIAIVAIHAVFYTLEDRCFPIRGWNFFFLFTYCQLSSFPVAVFTFISGYWLSKESIKSLGDYKNFLLRRFSRVLIPYFFWSFILLGYSAIKEHDINAYEIIFKLLTGRICIGYFFIVVIVQLYIITPVLQYINRKPYALILIIILSLINQFILYLSRLYNVIWHLPASLPFYSWIIFFEIGLLIGSRDNKAFITPKIRVFILPAVLVSLFISELEGMIILLKYGNLDFAISATKYSSTLYFVCILFGFLFIRERLRYWPRFLVTLGNYSFGIYLMHVIVLKRVINIIQKNNLIYSFQPLYQLSVVLVTILICFLLISAARRLLPKYFWSRILGF